MKDIPRQDIKYVRVRMVTGCTIEVFTGAKYWAEISPGHTESVISFGVNRDIYLDELLGDTLVPVYHEITEGPCLLIDLRYNERHVRLGYKPKRFVIRVPVDCYIFFSYKD